MVDSRDVLSVCCSTPCAEAEKDRPTILSRMEEKERAKNRLSKHHRPGRSGQRQKWKGSALKRDATPRAANVKTQLIGEGTGLPVVPGYLRFLAVRGEGASRGGKASLSGPVTFDRRQGVRDPLNDHGSRRVLPGLDRSHSELPLTQSGHSVRRLWYWCTQPYLNVEWT